MNKEIEVITPGDRAEKVGGSYQTIGTVAASFTTLAGDRRYVFEFDTPAGMLHIFGPSQILRLAAFKEHALSV